MSKEEKILREYVEFADINGSETVNILPLTIVDIMQEYSELQNKELVEKLDERSKGLAYYQKLSISLQSELTELKEKHKRDVFAAFDYQYDRFIRGLTGISAEQYYNETHKTQ